MAKRIGRRAGEGHVDQLTAQNIDVVDGSLTLNGTKLENIDANVHISSTKPSASESSDGDVWVKY